MAIIGKLARTRQRQSDVNQAINADVFSLTFAAVMVVLAMARRR